MRKNNMTNRGQLKKQEHGTARSIFADEFSFGNQCRWKNEKHPYNICTYMLNKINK